MDTTLLALASGKTHRHQRATGNVVTRSVRTRGRGCAFAWLRRICLLVLATLVVTPQAHAWWNASWDKRRPVDITWSGSTQTNFQVKVDVTFDADMQANFDDIRFVDSDDFSEIDYWRESYTASTSATLWAEVSSIPGNKTIYMYYGNAGVSTASNNLTIRNNTVFDATAWAIE